MADLPPLRMKTPEELAELQRISQAKQQVRKLAHSVCDRLSAERKKFILQCVADAHTEFLSDSADPIELHLFASNWNCDRGVEPLLEIVQHRACDAGTALWLYWDNDPYFYLRYRNLNDADDEEEETRTMLQLSRTIEGRMAAGNFATSIIPFDPQPWINEKYAAASWAVHTIPAAMYRPLGGS
ncbi:MAG: DUF4274 domain-containing protein [Aureliella sp.]